MCNVFFFINKNKSKGKFESVKDEKFWDLLCILMYSIHITHYGIKTLYFLKKLSQYN